MFSALNLLNVFLLSVVSWIPLNLTQFWVEPETPCTFSFKAEGSVGDESFSSQNNTVPYKVHNTDGDLILEGNGVVENGALSFSAAFPQGFYEVEFPESEQSFGIASQPAFTSGIASGEVEGQLAREPDPFFAIDAAFTWLVPNLNSRDDLINNARRMGITTYRERISWERIEAKEGTFNFDADSHSEQIRGLASKYGVSLLEVFHSAPDWIGRVGTYPRDLCKTSESWDSIASHWSSTWGSIEIWNEPDISFSGNLPADQYAPVVKTIAASIGRNAPSAKIVGGVIASYQDFFMESLAANDVLDSCDVFSFHTYCRAPSMQSVCARFCNWLAQNGYEWKPVWITECGRPWPKGANRANIDRDMESAIDIVQKGVIAKAMGIDAYFPFVYAFYEENDNNFGMTDRQGSPMRSIAGYSRAIFLLSGKDCVGDWDLDGVDQAWIFQDKRTGERVAALYRANKEADAKITLPLSPTFVERITGETVSKDERGVYNFSDGFLFVGIPANETLKTRSVEEVDRIREDRTKAKEERSVAERKFSEIVLRFEYDPETASPLSKGYRIVPDSNDSYAGNISVVSFIEEKLSAPIVGKVEALRKNSWVEVPDVLTLSSTSLDLRFKEKSEFQFRLDLSKITSIEEPVRLTFRVGADSVLSFDLLLPLTMEAVKKSVQELVPVSLSDRNSWSENVSPNGKMTFLQDLSAPAQWGFHIAFGEGDKWAYPRFKLPLQKILKPEESGQNARMSDFRGFLLKIKGDSNKPGGKIRLFTQNRKGDYYYTGPEISAIDGEDRLVYVPFSSLELSPYGGNTGPFDPNEVTGISIGGNSVGEEMTIQVSEFYLVK